MNFFQIKCPYCDCSKWKELTKESDQNWVEDLQEGEQAVCICVDCEKKFTVKVWHGGDPDFDKDFLVIEMTQPEDHITDLPGQCFLWADLDLGGVNITKISPRTLS